MIKINKFYYLSDGNYKFVYNTDLWNDKYYNAVLFNPENEIIHVSNFKNLDEYSGLNDTFYKKHYEIISDFEKFVFGKLPERGLVDLRDCRKGDRLLSALGEILFYERPTDRTEYLDHIVKYMSDGLGEGSRTDDGFVFKKNRIKETDHDIIKCFKD